MTPRTLGTMALFAMAAMAAGCANDGSALSTASVAPDKVAQAPKVDPACATLASQIDGLRKEGAVERLEQAATGKGKSVQVQRTSLAKQAELNKANADFQAKCGPKLPQTAQAAPAAAQVAPVAAAAASATQVKAATAVAPAAAQVAPKN
ncbi:MAG: hypothetical protein ABL897_01000 [Hyphomicrobium sp.]